MAARAHDVAALAIKGHSAYLNFPDLARHLPRPVTSAPKDIQAAASQAAAMKLPGQAEAEAELSRAKQDSSSCSFDNINNYVEESNEEEALFDLPDLFMDDANIGLCSYSSWHLLCAADADDEPLFLWDDRLLDN